VNKRRREQRALERPYLREMVNAHADQRQPKFPIPTNPEGKVIGLKTKWHNSVRSIARNVLRWDIRKYYEHPTEWKWILNTLTRDLDSLYTYTPYPLNRSYLSKYLSQALADDRAEWKKFYVQTGQQHQDMPDEAFQVWQPWWVSEEGRMKSEQMRGLRAVVKPKISNSGFHSSSLGGTARTEQCGSPITGNIGTHSESPEVRTDLCFCILDFYT
jgi:hypothetical protein